MRTKIIIVALSLFALNANAQRNRYDVNNDGEVTVTDAMMIINAILGHDNPQIVFPMSVGVAENPMVDTDQKASASGKRKSPVTNKTTLATDTKVFYVDYSYFSRRERPYYTGTGNYTWGNPEYKTNWVAEEGKWAIGTVDDSGEGHWPSDAFVDLDEDLVNFYAYANYQPGHFLFEDFAQSSDPVVVSKPCLHFQVDENSGEQKDLLVAKTADSYRRPGKTDGFLYFEFDHACTAVQFFITKTATLSNASIKVKGVRLHNVYNDGFYYFNTNGGETGDQSWAKLGYIDDTPSVYTIADNETEIDVTENYTDNLLSTETDKEDKYFFMIPQTTTPWYTDKNNVGSIAETTGAYIELQDCEITTNSKHYKGSAYIPFGVTWNKGNKQKAVITIGTGLRNANGERIFDSNGNLIQ